MTKKKTKYYAIWKGHHTGVFDKWEDCKAQIKGFKGAQYKAFSTFQAAKQALKDPYKTHLNKKGPKRKLSKAELEKIGSPNLNSIAVDAAVSGNPGVLEYRGVDTKTKKVLFKQGPFEEGTNNIGEFLAIVHGIAFLKKKNSDRILYTDSKTALGWVRKKSCNTKLKRSPKNKPLFELIRRAEDWLNKNNFQTVIVKWETKAWGEIPADFGRK